MRGYILDHSEYLYGIRIESVTLMSIFHPPLSQPPTNIAATTSALMVKMESALLERPINTSAKVPKAFVVFTAQGDTQYLLVVGKIDENATRHTCMEQ